MPETTTRKTGPIVLAIIDGWGLSPNWQGNAISLSNPPVMDRLWRSYPHMVLQAYQPTRQSQHHHIGSSDTSHAMIGTGRTILSDLEEIVGAATGGLFAKNPTLVDAMNAAVQKQRPVHLIGLVSDGGIHSDLRIVEALLNLAKERGVSDVVIHAITDGRDVKPVSAKTYLATIERACQASGIGRIATLVGRYWAMDRDNHWERTQLAVELWVNGTGTVFADPQSALTQAYQQGLTDESIPPIRIGNAVQPIEDTDVVIVWNTRVDRLRQLMRGLADPAVFRSGFRRTVRLPHVTKLVSLVSPNLPELTHLDIAFPPAQLRATLGEVLANRNLRQFRVAESEKSAHITYYFNGGREEPYPGEERLIVPSPKVRRFDLRPAMATPAIVRRLRERLASRQDDLMILNLANVDLVGHTGNLLATADAVRITDQAIGELADAVLAVDGTLLVTADHGNAEQMLTIPTDEANRAHTINPVPLIFIRRDLERDLVKQATVTPSMNLAAMISTRATLADIAPTILELFDIPVPTEMTGRSLLDQLH